MTWAEKAKLAAEAKPSAKCSSIGVLVRCSKLDERKREQFRGICNTIQISCESGLTEMPERLEIEIGFWIEMVQ